MSANSACAVDAKTGDHVTYSPEGAQNGDTQPQAEVVEAQSASAVLAQNAQPATANVVQALPVNPVQAIPVNSVQAENTPPNFDQFGATSRAVYDPSQAVNMTEKPKSVYHYQLAFLEFGNEDRLRGETVPRKIRLSHVFGGTTLNFSTARFVFPETTIYDVTLMGTINIVVPLGVRVDVKDLRVLSGNRKDDAKYQAHLKPNSPVITIKGGRFLGTVKITVNDRVPPLQIVEE